MKVSLKLMGLFSAFLSLGLTPSWARFSNPALGITDEERNAVYEHVYNSDNVAHEAGDVVVWKDGTVADGLEISTTTTANNALVAGVVAVGETCQAASWCKIQILGYHPAVTVGTVSAGNSLVTGTTGEQAEAYTIAQSTGSQANQGQTFGVFGTALASDSGGVAPVFLR